MGTTEEFDRMVERRGTGAIKWDAVDASFGGQDLLPMWIADMDFPAPPKVREALLARVEQGVYGYSRLSPAYYDAVIRWMDRRHHIHVEPSWVCFAAGVVSALGIAVQAVSEPGDDILIPSPVYGPFYKAAEDFGRRAVSVPLAREGLDYRFDFAALEEAVGLRTRALMLCSPHNPVGRVWERPELEELARFCRAHGLAVIADEIHSDLVFRPHTSFLGLDPEMDARTILCTAPTKTFNLAGIQASNIIIPDAALRRRYKAIAAKAHTMPSAFAEAAVTAAYDRSEDWLEALLAYLAGNIDLFCGTLRRELPQLRAQAPQGTYLVWVDCSGLGLEPDALQRFLVEECRLALSDGRDFGPGGAGFVRANLACPRSMVEECLRRLKAHLR